MLPRKVHCHIHNIPPLYPTLIYLLTYLHITLWRRVLLEKLTGLQLVKKFLTFQGTRRFITALTSVRHLSLSWASPIQSIYPHPTSWRFILMLSTHLNLGLSSGLFPFGFPTKTLYTPLSSPIRATWPANLSLLELITRTILGEEYKSFSSSLCSLLHSPVTSSFLGPNILLNSTRSYPVLRNIFHKFISCFLKISFKSLFYTVYDTKRTFGLHQMWVISGLHENLLDSLEGLCSVQFVSWFFRRIIPVVFYAN